MLDSKALASIPLIPANTAPPAPNYPWPKPFTSAMFLSFDVDAESAWTSKDAAHAQRLITMSYGGYELRVALVRHGIVYASSFRDDVRPYRHRLADGRPGTIEIPVTASYDDWMHGLSARFSPRPIFPKEHVLSIWKDELDEVRDWGAMVTTVLHPQCSGRPMRFRLLR